MDRMLALENKTLVLDLVEWIASRPRTYAEAMDAWRTSCPRLQIWEDTVELGLVARDDRGASETTVKVTPAGLAFLDAERPGWGAANQHQS